MEPVLGGIGASLPCLDLLLAVRSGYKNVLPDEPAFLHHLDGVFETPEVRVGIIGAEGEFCPGCLCLFDERRARDLVAIVDLYGNVAVDSGSVHLMPTFGRPERFVS